MYASRRSLLGSLALAGALRASGVRLRAAEAFEVVRSDDDGLALRGRRLLEAGRRAAPERPCTSPLSDEHRRGVFRCAGCSLELISSAAKFGSRTGWPSFWQPLEGAVAT